MALLPFHLPTIDTLFAMVTVPSEVDASALAKLVAEKFKISQESKKNAPPVLPNHPFSQTMANLSKQPLVYEDASLLDYAMEVLPLESLYTKAAEDYEKDPSFSEQDYLVKALLKYEYPLLNQQH